MDNKFLECINNGSEDEMLRKLTDFNNANDTAKSISAPDKMKELFWDSIFTRLKTLDNNVELTRTCLNTLRILSREKNILEKVITEERVSYIMNISGLSTPDKFEHLEGLKVLFNMIFQSQIVQVMCVSEGFVQHTLNKIKCFYEQDRTTSDYEYFVNRTFFLITALLQECIPKLRNEYNGLEILINYLKFSITREQSARNTEICCEILKTLYNVCADLSPISKSLDESVEENDLTLLKTLTSQIRQVLSNFVQEDEIPSEYSEDLRRHCIDILAALPMSLCHEELVPTGKARFQYEDHDLNAVESTVQHLDLKLLSKRKWDELVPVLYALHNMATGSRIIRKYLKRRILPPLSRKDVESLPEVGSSLRNRLCAMLTSVHPQRLVDLTANFLFVLCKEKVSRLVKYTGYGNAAGLLANKGLMLGGSRDASKYSDTDKEEDSDTEEYREIEHTINQIEGRIQQERPDPMEGMTDEQKEFEALKLIQAIDKMERSTGIKPCRIGHDGRPQPIEHVLQLQEALEDPMKGLQREQHESDSDSD